MRGLRQPTGLFEQAVAYAERSGAALVHDAAYIDLVFDGRAPTSFLATPGARAVGVELWSMSKSFGMAGWRIGFVVGNAEIVERINLLSDHVRVGMLAALQRAAVRRVTRGARPQYVEERRDGPTSAVRDRLLGGPDRGRRALRGRRLRLGAAAAGGVTVEGLLRAHRVVARAGRGLRGRAAPGYARVSAFAVSDEVLEAGIERLAPALAGARA